MLDFNLRLRDAAAKGGQAHVVAVAWKATFYLDSDTIRYALALVGSHPHRQRGFDFDTVSQQSYNRALTKCALWQEEWRPQPSEKRTLWPFFMRERGEKVGFRSHFHLLYALQLCQTCLPAAASQTAVRFPFVCADARDER